MPLTGADAASDDQASIDAKVQIQVDGPLGVERCQCLHHVQGRPQGEFGVIFVRHRRAKEGHNLVADKLVDDPSIPFDDRYQAFEAAVHQVAHHLGVQRLGQGGETGDVGEHHGHQLTLARQRWRGRAHRHSP